MSNVNFFFTERELVIGLLIVGGVVYVSLMVSLRILAGRTITSRNMFNFIMTMTIGSASVGRVRPVALVGGVE